MLDKLTAKAKLAFFLLAIMHYQISLHYFSLLEHIKTFGESPLADGGTVGETAEGGG